MNPELMQTIKELRDAGCTWDEVAEELELDITGNGLSKRYRKALAAEVEDDEDDQVDMFEMYAEIRKERYRAADERSQANAIYKRMAREDSIKEIAHDLAETIGKNIKLDLKGAVTRSGSKAGILCLSDVHYGVVIDSIYNKYNPLIAQDRLAQLTAESIKLIKAESIKDLYVVNLGDLIAGRIHLQLRINSQYDVITQIMEISELVAQMLAELNKHVKLHYTSTYDNHSRLEPNKKESLQLESLCRITDWYLKERCGSFVDFIDDTLTDDISKFEVMGHTILATHGDQDKPKKVVRNLSMMNGLKPDMILTAHLHHLSTDEENGVMLISNSSMMGTDSFAESLRLNARPSQSFIVVTRECVCEKLIPIWLD